MAAAKAAAVRELKPLPLLPAAPPEDLAVLEVTVVDESFFFFLSSTRIMSNSVTPPSILAIGLGLRLFCFCCCYGDVSPKMRGSIVVSTLPEAKTFASQALCRADLYAKSIKDPSHKST